MSRGRWSSSGGPQRGKPPSGLPACALWTPPHLKQPVCWSWITTRLPSACAAYGSQARTSTCWLWGLSRAWASTLELQMVSSVLTPHVLTPHVLTPHIPFHMYLHHMYLCGVFLGGFSLISQKKLNYTHTAVLFCCQCSQPVAWLSAWAITVPT